MPVVNLKRMCFGGLGQSSSTVNYPIVIIIPHDCYSINKQINKILNKHPLSFMLSVKGSSPQKKKNKTTKT